MKTCPTCQQTYSDEVEFCPRDGSRLAAQATETEAQLAAGLSRRFRIVRRLGAGGMGTVFLAEQIGVGNRPVALKVLSRKLLDDPDFLLRFQNEAASTGRIHHPNVVTIHESGQADDGTPYIAMEFLEGESLRQTLARRGALPVPEVAEILQQAARGLNAAHKLGIIHRDLKPDNIFLTYPDDDSVAPVSPPANVQVKIVDFGIAKLRESATHTQTGMVLGTPAYMSFEQASGMRSDELDARSDIYSLGVVTYEMLTGRTPFQSDTAVGFLRKHLMEEPPPFRAVAQGLHVPPQVEAVVMKALKKEREERYQSALEFAHAFVAAAQPPPAAQFSQPLPSTKIVSPPTTREPDAPVQLAASAQATADLKPIVGLTAGDAIGPEPARGIPPPSGGKWLPFAACLIVFLLLVAAGYWLWIGPSPAPERILTGHAGGVEGVAFSPDGKLLASGGWDKSIKLWDVGSGTLRQTLTGHSEGVSSVAFSPDGKLLASGSYDKTIKQWDVDSGTLKKTLTGYAGDVTSVAFSPDGNLMASGGSDKTIQLWDVTSGTLRQTLVGHSDEAQTVAFSPDGKRLASGGFEGVVDIWDMATEASTQTSRVQNLVAWSIAFSPNGKLLALGTNTGEVMLWGMAPGIVGQTLTGHCEQVMSVAFSPDGGLLASGNYDHTVKVWDVATGTLKQTLRGHSQSVNSVSFSPDGKLLASGSYDTTIALWRVAQ